MLPRIADAHAVICILTSGSLHDKQQLDIMAHLAAEPDRQFRALPSARVTSSKSESSGPEGCRSVLVSTLTFAFMSESALRQSLLDGGFSEECALRYSVSAFKLFRHIAISLNVHAAESVLKAQALQVLARLPRQAKPMTMPTRRSETAPEEKPVSAQPEVNQGEIVYSLEA